MKKQKIVILGGLGYIGSELCLLYSGEARYKDIVVLDNKFVSERVSQLRSWGIAFIQGSILDEQLMKEILQDADLVYHLAGITDVAYTKTQSTDEKDKEIREYGITGTRNVINNIPKTCKIIFPSTHVVYEGLTETKFDIVEEEPTKPTLVYATGKVISEQDLSISGVNYIVVRLGSVYGYSTDTMRINIMPNLFSKIASQDGTISLFSGGVQYKSLVAIWDVVRAMKFLAESEYNKEIFHLSNENLTIKEVAEICKEYNPSLQLLETNDEIPNLGYTLSNKKLLSTGFTFLYNIKDSIKQMITNWSDKKQPEGLEYILKGGKEYIDARGKILNYELPEPINLIGYIESTRGSIRANHYHPIQEQKCLLVTGSYISVIKDLSYPDAPLEYKVIRAGDIAVIRPNVAHTMVFLQDSIFLNLVRGEREHENYGVTHTIPYVLVTEEDRDELLKNYKTDCRCCGYTNLKSVVNLGESPLANNLLDSKDQPYTKYPLELNYCEKCYNVQLSVVVPAGEMFDNYLYTSSTSQVFRNHFEKTADQYIQELGLNSNSLVLDIGSNDGIALKPLQDRGIKVVGVEPAGNIATMANSKGIPTIHGYFDNDTANQVYKNYGSPDLITASNVFAHADNLKGIIQTVFSLLNKGGTFIVEVQYLLDTIKDLTFDNIYHEHVNYWSVTTLNKFCDLLGYTLFHVEHIDTHGGSIRCFIGKEKQVRSSVTEFIEEEGRQGIHSVNTLIEFGKRIENVKKKVLQNVKTLKRIYTGEKDIVAYGSPAKATTALNYFGIDSSTISFTIEDNTLKVGKYLPGVCIPVVDHSYGPHKPAKICIVLAWNFYDSIVEKHQYMIDKGTKFISIKDLQLDNISFASLLSTKYSTNSLLRVNEYIFDYKEFAFSVFVSDYWKNYYNFGSVNILPTSYTAMLEAVKKISKDKYIVDIGANCGMFCIPATLLGYNVIAFDPVIDNINSLNIGNDRNGIEGKLQVFQYAISDKNEETSIYIPECPDNASMDLETAISKMSSKDYIIEEVKAITFDSWIESNLQYRNIGLIKIDVQGHEQQVIDGMKKFLSNAHDIYIICEFDSSITDDSSDLYKTIISCGFTELYPITNDDKIFYKK